MNSGEEEIFFLFFKKDKLKRQSPLAVDCGTSIRTINADIKSSHQAML